MRTTVTLDKDVERLLKTAMHQQRRSFKETLNSALRTGLAGRQEHPKGIRFKVHARPMGLKAGIDPAGFNKVSDDLEIEARTTARSKR